MSDNPINLAAGLPMTKKRYRFCNRTGAALLYTQVAMLDILGTQAETTNIGLPKGEGDSIWENLTPVTQAGHDTGAPIVVCDEPNGIADNAWGYCITEGPDVEVATLDDDVSTTDADRSDVISMLVSESAVAVSAAATGSNYRALGKFLEDAAVSSATAARTVDATAHRRRCIWTGGVPMAGYSDT